MNDRHAGQPVITALQLRDSQVDIRVDLLDLISPQGAASRWNSWRRVSIIARALRADENPTYRSSFDADIRDVLMLGHFENFRDDLRGYLDLGAAAAVVLGGERASEVRLELPPLQELGFMDTIAEVAVPNGSRLSCLVSLRLPDLRGALQSVELAVDTFAGDRQ